MFVEVTICLHLFESVDLFCLLERIEIVEKDLGDHELCLPFVFVIDVCMLGLDAVFAGDEGGGKSFKIREELVSFALELGNHHFQPVKLVLQICLLPLKIFDFNVRQIDVLLRRHQLPSSPINFRSCEVQIMTDIVHVHIDIVLIIHSFQNLFVS